MIKRWLARKMVNRTKARRFGIEELEQKHVSLAQPFPNDSSCFYGGDSDGNALITRLAFRGPERAPEFWYDVRLVGHGQLRMSPGSLVEGNGFALGPMGYECVEPGAKWRLRCAGPLRGADGSEHHSRLDLTFIARHPVFDYADSSDRRLIADAVAKEKWSRAFFRQLQDLEQTHYEQFGVLEGTVTVDDATLPLHLLAVRDHSFGSRDWRTWDRHYWVSGCTPEGWGWTAVAIRYDFCGPLYAGFVVDPAGASDAIVECTSLAELSRDGVWPEQGRVQFATRSGKRHTVEFRRDGVFAYLMDRAYLMKEGIGVYQLDGMPARGLLEFGFKSATYGDQVPE